jgi:hypothetical protein
MLPLVLVIVDDCHYKDKSDNVKQWEEQVVALALLSL